MLSKQHKMGFPFSTKIALGTTKIEIIHFIAIKFAKQILKFESKFSFNDAKKRPDLDAARCCKSSRTETLLPVEIIGDYVRRRE